MFRTLSAAAAVTLMLGGCSTMADLPSERVGQATMMFANGMPAGTVQLLSNGQTLSIAAAVTGMEPGAHGFHLHTAGRCDAPDFSSAGGHLNPNDNSHGSLSPGGQHLGDMPNLTVGSNGSGSIQYRIDRPAPAALDAIFDADGTAVVVHSGADDYRTDPSGNAGSRVACGVLQRVR